MLTAGLFAGYSFGVGSILYNIVQAKLQDDFEQDVRALREYDFTNETINVEKDLPANCMLLIRHRPETQKDLAIKGA